MACLRDGEKSLIICVAVSTQCRRVTDRQTDILQQHSPRPAYALRGKVVTVIGLTLHFTKQLLVPARLATQAVAPNYDESCREAVGLSVSVYQ